MLGYTEEDSVLFRALNWEGALENRNDYIAVLSLAKELFNGDLALFALWEDNNLAALDDQGRAWSARLGAELENELNILINHASVNCQLINPEISLLTPLLGKGERIKSLLLKMLPADRGRQGLFLIAFRKRDLFSFRENQLLDMLAANINLTWRSLQLSSQVDRMSQALAALEEIGAAIATTNDFEEVIELVLQKLTQLIGAESGGVMLFDEEKQELVLQRPAFGAQEEEINLYRLSVPQYRPLKAQTVEVFLQGRPFVCNDAPSEKKYLQQFIKLFGIRNSLDIPLVIGKKGIGVLHLINKHQGYFTEQDVQLMSILASELAMLLENARLINQTKQQERRSRAQHAMLARSVSIHQEFTQMVLKGQGIKSIAGALARMVNGKVEVTDQFFRLIADSSKESSGEEQERVIYLYEPTELISNDKMRKFFERLAKEKVPMRLPAWLQDRSGTVVVPVVIGTDVLGYVLIQETGKSFEEIDITAIGHASTVIALEMMKEKTNIEVISRLKGDCLDDLLSGNYKSEQEILDRANYLGYDLAKPFQVLVLDIDNFSDFVTKQQGDEGVVTRIKRSLFETVKNVVMDNSPKSIVTGKSDTIIILANVGGQGKEKGRSILCPLDLAREIKNKVCLVLAEITVSIGVGRVAHHLKDISESHQEAKTCLKMLKKFGHKNKLVAFEQLGIYRLLHQVENVQELSGFARQTLEPIMAYDAKNGTMLVDTLRCYMENNCNLQRTAKASYLHISTLSYRLKRIKELANLDLNVPEQRLNVQVALKILDMLPKE